MKIFLHIGAPKCASSSIQQHFSYNNLQEKQKFAYGTIDISGSISTGKEVDLRTITSTLDYASSYDNIVKKQEKIKLSLQECAKQYDILLLSCEAWYNRQEDFALFQEIFSDYEVAFIYVIRPCVSWYNSTWWQWKNWDLEVKSLDTWLEKTLVNNIAKIWLESYKAFAHLPYINKVHLLSLQSNIIEQIYNIMDLDFNNQKIEVHNISASAEHLHFLNNNKHMRSVQQSAVDFIFAKHFKKRSPTPFVFTKENVEDILSATKPYLIELAKFVSNENILENEEYWQIDAYNAKIEACERNKELSEEIMLELIRESQEKILELEIKLNPKTATNKRLEENFKIIAHLDNKLKQEKRKEFLAKNPDLQA